jgi:hypothetical protein
MSFQADLPTPEFALSGVQAGDRFRQLQEKLVPLWPSMRTMTSDEQTVVVVPSQTIDLDLRGAEMQGYEERFLFLLLLLRQPRLRVIYVTSQTILPSTVDYYLSLLPEAVASRARERLFLVAPEDRSLRPLTLKLLERPQLIERIRALIPDRDRAHLIPYNTTDLERDLALRLGIPMYAADPDYLPLGTKSGCRQLFAEEGVAHPLGRESLGSLDQVIEAIVQMRRQKPDLCQVMVKLNEGISGEGNAVVDLRGLPLPKQPGEAAAVARRVHALELEYPGETTESYFAKLEQRGAVVEERICGEDFRSPSVQLRVTPLGEVELLSTHDQVLGGPSGQLYLGCRFPADRAYGALIAREAFKVGRRLAREGVLGRFAVDFVVVRRPDGQWQAHAIELNLRKGGTTHPYLTLQFLTDGHYEPGAARFLTPGGRAKYYVASDHIESPLYRAFTPDDLFGIAARHGLHFSRSRLTGVVFHMMATLAENGRVGAVAIADTPAEAERLFQRVREVLDAEAQAALAPRRLPAA